MTEPNDPRPQTGQAPPGRPSWVPLLAGSGLAAGGVMALIAAWLGDVEAGVVALIFALGSVAVRSRWRRWGAVTIAVASTVTLSFMLAAAVTNIREGSRIGAILISAGLAAVSLAAGAIAAVSLVRRDWEPATDSWWIVGGCVALFVALVGWGSMAPSETDPPPGLVVMAENLAFSESSLSAPTGDVTVTLSNQDLFWHTFTIDELAVDLAVPVGGERSTSFRAPPGEYEFYCDIPGHPEAGMVGTLSITD